MQLPLTLRVGRDHPDYPIAAAALERSPDTLFLKGQLPPGPSLAIVGTRAATEEALRFTEQLAFELARLGIAIWSGGAKGIDAAAHRGALEADGRTVVVMGTGFCHVYPADHAALFSEILEKEGAWLTMCEPEQRGTKWTFLQRNGLLAALVDGVVIVQAPLRSGARSTTAAARKMGRRVWVVPHPPWDTLGAGCVEELRLGAQVLPRLADLAEVLGKKAKVQAGGRNLPSDLSKAERAVVQAVRRGNEHLDPICEKTGLPVQEVTAALLTLSLRQVLVQGVDGRVRVLT